MSSWQLTVRPSGVPASDFWDRPLLSEAKPSYVYSILKSTCSELQKVSQTAAEHGKAELRILDFETTWSEFQKASQTTAEQGNDKLGILNFKTIWSEFHKAIQTAAEQGKTELRILDFKTTCSEFQTPSQTATEQSKAELRIHGQSFRNSNRLLLPTALHYLFMWF